MVQGTGSTYADNTTIQNSDLQPLCISEDGPKRTRRIKSFLSGNPGIFVGLVCAIIIGLLIGFVIKCAVIRLRPEDAPRHVGVKTACGYVSGKVEDTVFEFRGIPYADPPRRWRPAVFKSDARTCWGGVRDATKFAPICFQYNKELKQYKGSEDCLYLNIWTPQIDPAAKLDVMVYIHGGGLMTGSGSEPGSSPSPELAANHNKVFVSFNYRLNVFGYLTLRVLSQKSEDGSSGNYGLSDQVAALKWIQRNIHWFGGDRHRVTVFGEGSGATSILALLSLEESQGLFQKAWLISPSPRIDITAEKAEEQNSDFVNETGCYSVNPDMVYECLMTLTPEKAAEGIPWKQWMNEHYRELPELEEKSAALLTVNGSLLGKSPTDAWSSGQLNDVPILVGSAAQEADDVPIPSDLGAWNFTTYDEYIHLKLDPFGVNDVATSALIYYDHHYTPEYQLTSMVTDIRALCPLNDLLEVATSKFTRPVYRYVVQRFPTQKMESENAAMYAFHGVDLYAFFDTLSNFAESTSEKDMQFKEMVKSTVLEFVESGRLGSWQQYPAGLTLLSDTKDLTNAFNRDKCDFWKAKDLSNKYAWMN